MFPPTHVAAAAVLIADPDGRLLMVESPYRDYLVLPGGMVEPGETPAGAAEREVFEEVGLTVRITRLVAIEAKPARVGVPDGLQFVFDTEQLTVVPPLMLQIGEVSAAHWLPPAEAVAAHGPHGSERLEAAFAARSSGGIAYLDRSLP